MKFTCIIKINAPISAVVSGFKNEEVMKESQDGFVSKTIIEGAPWAEGSKSRFVYKNLELIETVLINKLPAEFKALYEHKDMVNTMHCRFTATAADKTQMEQEIHYTEFRGFMPKIMSKLFPGMFKKQVQKWLDQFKAVVERKNA